MYLKSIEVHGFKSFANKILFDFHNGITGIVGPNGSGKSNVADAVRWVLGEQRAKQLRGASMQDVIFAGTENRKPLSYAYVAITLDNSDKQLNIDYQEVTIARRVYRSGESEYLMNGTPCRLKDVNELFYDTGIGKEGYSIIGQGQIEKILNGKPEERRELFDEAAGIVKYKRRKATAQKKLENQKQNLVRVKDVLSELEKQTGPLERQAEKAKIFLKKKEEQKVFDINLFLIEMKSLEEQQKDLHAKLTIAQEEYEKSGREFEKVKARYAQAEEVMQETESSIESLRLKINHCILEKGEKEGNRKVILQQIKGEEQSQEHLKKRQKDVLAEKQQREENIVAYQKQMEDLQHQLIQVKGKYQQHQEDFSQIQSFVSQCREKIQEGETRVLEIFNYQSELKVEKQKYLTMMEQTNIRGAQMNKQLLEQKSQEESLQSVLLQEEAQYQQVLAEYEILQKQEEGIQKKRREWQEKQEAENKKLEEETRFFHKEQSRLESMINIAERYEGYGNSIRRVMECRGKYPGILGVVADLIKVGKQYETAIETALGGAIQNIVTQEEDTAKKMIQYLKENRYGRATFLPLTSVGKKQVTIQQQALKEPGVIGMGNTLVQTAPEYQKLCDYLLGKIYVVDHIDHAVALAKKYQYSLRIVTLEGESLNPGGSMTGGAFQKTGNLLGRKREIQELEKSIEQRKEGILQQKQRLLEIQTAKELLKDDSFKVAEEMKQLMLEKNTLEMQVQKSREKVEEKQKLFAQLKVEGSGLEKERKNIRENIERIQQQLQELESLEKEKQKEIQKYQSKLEKQGGLLEVSQQQVSQFQMEEANILQKSEFCSENLNRIRQEMEKLQQELEQLQEAFQKSQNHIKLRQQEIKEIQATLESMEEHQKALEEEVQKFLEKKEGLTGKYKIFLQEREDLSDRMANLDKEIFRLTGQKEKIEENQENHRKYMWEEYELTYHNAIPLQNMEYRNSQEIKKKLQEIREEIRKLGDVNVNAIEDYKEVFERYTFLKTQHDDLITAEKSLLEIIEDLDVGMRKQFQEKFQEIRREFDQVFKELFGGGKGTLELVEEEDILECGIRIIAQPPGKKLQNMMQLSGGEKSLTAIALLFAIQNLKPSPFCLLDEIEAALDDSNVGRFAKYLHRLTKDTQFIVITHRRGTMAAADRLYGITMQEKGVSTLVSVNLIEEKLEE